LKCGFLIWFNEASNDPRETTLVTLAHHTLIWCSWHTCRAF